MFNDTMTPSIEHPDVVEHRSIFQQQPKELIKKKDHESRKIQNEKDQSASKYSSNNKIRKH